MTHNTPDEIEDDGQSATPIRTVKVAGAQRKHFRAKLRAGYFFGSGKEVIEGPAEVSIPIAPDQKGNPGLRGYLHMIENVREAEDVLNIPHRTFLDLQNEATESARRINAARSGPGAHREAPSAPAPAGITLTPEALQSIIASAVREGVLAGLAAAPQASPTLTTTAPAPDAPKASGNRGRNART